MFPEKLNIDLMYITGESHTAFVLIQALCLSTRPWSKAAQKCDPAGGGGLPYYTPQWCIVSTKARRRSSRWSSGKTQTI